MTKRDFLKNFAVLGLASPFMGTLLTSCSKQDALLSEIDSNFSGKVIIIGAGAAGITAGHLLRQQGIDFQILEASSIHGGRVKKAADFVDFPIDLGAEWIHTDPSILAKLNNDPQSTMDIDIMTYNPQKISVWKNGKMRKRNIASHFYSEYKFKSTTWFDFFDQVMIPKIQDKIEYNCPVTEIDYSNEKIVVRTSDDSIYEADKVLITVPISILKKDYIHFVPALPVDKRNAIQEEQMPDGLKVFIEFSERFYPDLVMVDNLIEAAFSSDHTYYDAAFGKDSNRHVFALFTVGEKASAYTDLGSDEAIFKQVMSELDEMFDGQASQYYLRHQIQNWTQEPFIQGSYSYGYSSPSVLAAPVSNQLYFAGEATAPDGNTSTVHGAAKSAFVAVRRMLEG